MCLLIIFFMNKSEKIKTFRAYALASCLLSFFLFLFSFFYQSSNVSLGLIVIFIYLVSAVIGMVFSAKLIALKDFDYGIPLLVLAIIVIVITFLILILMTAFYLNDMPTAYVTANVVRMSF